MIIRRILLLLNKGELKFIINGISKRLNSKILAIGLRRDLNEEFQKPMAKIEIKTRLSKESDHAFFKDEMQNYGLVEKDIKHCYVATDSNDLPCFRQWLMEPSENEKIKEFFTGNFPTLEKDEALLEGGFITPSHRGLKIMSAAVAEISEKASSFGARYVIVYVNVNNIASLKNIRRAGFHPYKLRREKWFLFKKRVRFVKLPKDILAKYYSDTSRSS